MFALPGSADAFAADVTSFQSMLLAKKRELPAPHPGWYPYNSFTGLDIGLELIRPIYDEFLQGVNNKPVADIGCGDGDLSFAFAKWGAEVDAIDYPPTNFNQMMGVERLANALDLSVARRRLNLDDRFDFPQKYGLALFLGALPFAKSIFRVGSSCVNYQLVFIQYTNCAGHYAHGYSNRGRTLAYLASPVEVNSDVTNFWIFSLGGLLRFLQRTRWSVRGIRRLSGFSLPVYLPEGVLCPNLTLEASINSKPCGNVCFDQPGLSTFTGELSSEALYDPNLIITFHVQSNYSGDGRELGVCIPIENNSVPFRVY